MYSQNSVKNLAKITKSTPEDIEEYLRKVLSEKEYAAYMKKQESLVKKEKKSVRKNISDWEILKIDYKWLLLFFGLVILVYTNAVDNEFVSDDRSGILFHPRIDSINYIFNNTLENVNAFRLYLLHTVFHKSPWGYRVYNIVTHMVNLTIFYLLVYRLKNKKTAIFSALLFAVHPILVESITWIAGGIYPFYSMLGLISFYTYVKISEKYNENGKFDYLKNKLFYISFLTFGLSLFSNKKAIAVGFLFILFEIIYSSVKKKLVLLLPYFSLTAFYAFLLVKKIPTRVNTLATQYYSDNLNSNPLIQIPIAITEYLKLTFYPIGLSFYQTELKFTGGQYLFRVFLFSLLIVGLLVVYVRARGSFKNAFLFWEEPTDDGKINIAKYLNQKDAMYIAFWGFWAIVALGPTLTPFGISWVVAERYLYLSSLGIFAIFGLIFYKLYKIETLKYVTIGVFVVIMMLLSFRTYDRNKDWQNEDSLWVATVKTSPSGHQIHNNMGDYYSRRGDLINAVNEFRLATQIKPNYADAYHNLAITYQKLAEESLNNGNEEEASSYLNLAAESHSTAIQYNPVLWQSYYGLATIYYTVGDIEKAEEYLNQALSIAPYETDLLFKVGVIYYRIAEYEKAIQMMNRVLQIAPQNEQAKGAMIEMQRKIQSK